MNVKLLSFIVFSLFLHGISAQPLERNLVRYGFRAGLNFSNMNFSKGSPPPAVPIESSWNEGGIAGFFIIAPLSGSFYIQPEYLFSQMGGKATSLSTSYEFNYISLPVFLRWEAISRLSFIAGPQFQLLINAKQKNKESGSMITKGLEDRSLGATFGVEYDITSTFGVGIKYMLGLNHISSEAVMDSQEFKYEMFQFSLFYIF